MNTIPTVESTYASLLELWQAGKSNELYYQIFTIDVLYDQEMLLLGVQKSVEISIKDAENLEDKSKYTGIKNCIEFYLQNADEYCKAFEPRLKKTYDNNVRLFEACEEYITSKCSFSSPAESTTIWNKIKTILENNNTPADLVCTEEGHTLLTELISSDKLLNAFSLIGNISLLNEFLGFFKNQSPQICHLKSYINNLNAKDQDFICSQANILECKNILQFFQEDECVNVIG